MNRIRWLIAIFLALCEGVFLARMDLISDDTGILVGLTLIGCFLLGVLAPRRGWLFGFVVAFWLVAAEVFNFFWIAPRPSVRQPAQLLLVVLFINGVCLAGAGAGWAAQRLFVMRNAERGMRSDGSGDQK